MLYHPPTCSPDWTTEERLRLAAWIAEITLMRMREDNPLMLVTAKKPMYDLWHAAHGVLTAPAEVLEENRAALEKPYDPSKNFHKYWVTGGGEELLKYCGGI